MDSIKFYKEIDLLGITGDFQLCPPVNCEVRFHWYSWCFTLDRGGSKIDAILGVINYLSVIFHQNGIIHGKYAKICEISHKFIPLL